MNRASTVALSILLCGLTASGQSEDAASRSTLQLVADETNRIVITSRKLVFDYQKSIALFEGNVIVTDPKMIVTSEKLTIIFSDESQPKSIVAEGNVHIRQKDRVAMGDRADYDVVNGSLVLTGNPRIRQGRNMLMGKKIRFFRNEDRVICEPDARLLIYPGEGGGLNKLFGE